MKTTRRYGLSSARPAFLVWLAFVGLAVGVGSASVARADDRRDDFSWPVESDVRVDVEIVQGKIEIKGWDKDEVRVRARGGGADSLDIEASEGWVSIRMPGRSGVFGFGGGVDVDLEIDVPEAAELHVRTINGPIRIEDVVGSVSAQSANGKIEVRGEPVEARLETVSSSIDFEGHHSSVDARTVSGSIKLEGVAGDVSAATMSGSIKVEGVAVERIDLKSMSGSIGFEGDLARDARARFKSYSGSVKLELTPETSARFDVQSFSGSLTNEFSEGRRRPRRGRSSRFEAGEGEGSVVIETFSGSVKIESKD